MSGGLGIKKKKGHTLGALEAIVLVENPRVTRSRLPRKEACEQNGFIVFVYFFWPLCHSR